MACLYYDYPLPSSAIVENNSTFDHNTEEIFKLYKKEIKNAILNMIVIIEEKFTKHFDSIEVGVTLIHSICKKKCDTCQNFPEKDIHKWALLRLKWSNDKCIFIDFLKKRTYIGWNDFIDNNNLPEGFMFYPMSGFYDSSQTLYQNITPASKGTEIILKTADIASHILNWVGGVIVGFNLIFPIATPVVICTGAAISLTSTYQCGRIVNRLKDMYAHNSNILRKTQQWINLAIAAIGVIAAPLHVLASITSEVNTTVTTGKVLTIFRRSACVTQCTLEIFRTTLEFIDNNFKITLESVLRLRLDLFSVTGLMMSGSYIKNILEVNIDM